MEKNPNIILFENYKENEKKMGSWKENVAEDFLKTGFTKFLFFFWKKTTSDYRKLLMKSTLNFEKRSFFNNTK